MRHRKDKSDLSVVICATRIVAIMSIHTHQARRAVYEEKRAGTLINAAGRDSVKSVIFMDNGTVVASPLTVERLMLVIEQAGYRPHDVRKQRTHNIKVYEISDEGSAEGPDLPDVIVGDSEEEDGEPDDNEPEIDLEVEE